MIEMDREQVQVEDLICKPPEIFAVYLLEVHCEAAVDGGQHYNSSSSR